LKPLQDNWQMIRDEALQLFEDGHIRAAAKYNDLGFNSSFARLEAFLPQVVRRAAAIGARAVPRTVALSSRSRRSTAPCSRCFPRAAISAGIAIRSRDRCAITWGS
jgi:hypothetical protein